MINRDDAIKLLTKSSLDTYTLIHSKMVAHAMEEYAKKNNKNSELYYLTGLLHDIDWTKDIQKDPTKHGILSTNLLSTFDCDPDMITAIRAHAFNHTGVMPSSNLDFALIACDEVCGLLHAYSLMRPESLNNMNLNSLKKKFNDFNFASKVDRELVLKGINGIGIDLEKHLQFLIDVFNNCTLE